MIIILFSLIYICSSTTFWTMWLGLEMFNFFFIPWLMGDSNNYKSFKIFYYFVIQVIGSGLMLIGMVDITSPVFFYSMFISLILKLGSFPFHSWVLLVIEKMDWKKFSFFMTISKMGTVSIMAFFNPTLFFIKFLWGGVLVPFQGLKTMSIRKMLTFSSIAHMTWIMTAISINKTLLIFFLLLYWLVFVFTCLMFESKNSLKDLFHSSNLFWEIFFILCAMGFPPFLGFFPKMLVLKYLCNDSLFLEAFYLGLTSIIPFYFYIKMIIMMFFCFGFKNISNVYTYKNSKKLLYCMILLFISLELFIW
uniref:NADH-ubiquinone oxidoreductase chain 2 n=1 Tax=Osborniella crotophagae TaxID=1912107 RepID=A0A7T1HEY8_9NEOP|nr:NADH dehydrogenase subunit 2 [Osborniella crotophagae]